jgi:amphi-Trp domain-containing protein
MEATPEVELDAAATGADDTEGSVSDRTGQRQAKGRIKFESVMQRSEAAAYFGALVDGLKHGQLQFRHGEERLSLAPTDQVVVEVKAIRKGDKEKVSFELEWKCSSEDALGLSR